MSSSAHRFRTILSESGITADVVELPQSTRTAKEAAAAIGCGMAQIAKSLVFRRLDTDRPVLVIASGPNRVDEELVSGYLQAPIAKADAEYVRSSTGFSIGGVPPLGHAAPLETVIDQDLLGFDLIWAAAGTPRAVFSIAPQQLVEVTGGKVLSISPRQVPEGEATANLTFQRSQSPLVCEGRKEEMHRATRTLVLTLGILAGIMGIEHGTGEVLQGYRPTGGVYIESWPDSPFFEIMSGEPAMTIIPNYLVTGLLAILFSGAFLVVLIRLIDKKIGVPALFVLSALMLLSGGGYGPPIVGIIASLIALKLRSPLQTWRKLPAKVHSILSKLWPWSYGVCLAGWVMLFPGTALTAHFTGSDSALLMIVPIIVAFCLIPLTLLTGFSRDILKHYEAPGLRHT